MSVALRLSRGGSKKGLSSESLLLISEHQEMEDILKD